MQKDRHQVTVRPKGRCIFNTVPMMLAVVRNGIGLATLPADIAEPLIWESVLVQVPAD